MLPIEIIDYIVFLSAIKCHVCQKHYNIHDYRFYITNSNSTYKWYYCSNQCYDFI